MHGKKPQARGAWPSAHDQGWRASLVDARLREPRTRSSAVAERAAMRTAEEKPVAAASVGSGMLVAGLGAHRSRRPRPTDAAHQTQAIGDHEQARAHIREDRHPHGGRGRSPFHRRLRPEPHRPDTRLHSSARFRRRRHLAPSAQARHSSAGREPRPLGRTDISQQAPQSRPLLRRRLALVSFGVLALRASPDALLAARRASSVGAVNDRRSSRPKLK